METLSTAHNDNSAESPITVAFQRHNQTQARLTRADGQMGWKAAASEAGRPVRNFVPIANDGNLVRDCKAAENHLNAMLEIQFALQNGVENSRDQQVPQKTVEFVGGAILARVA